MPMSLPALSSHWLGEPRAMALEATEAAAIPTHLPSRLEQSADYLPGFAAATVPEVQLAQYVRRGSVADNPLIIHAHVGTGTPALSDHSVLDR